MKKMELLFPEDLITNLSEIRGHSWQELVAHIIESNNPALLQAAFVLLVARISNCNSCNSNSFRATQGCLICSKQTIKRFRGSDRELTILFQKAEKDVQDYFSNINLSCINH